MKSAILIAALAAVSVPAAASVAHQTSTVHNGQQVSLNYEPVIETRLRQIGLGPRATASCMWTSKISVQRTVNGADGQPVAALQRIVGERKTRSGQRLGHCNTVSEKVKARFAGSEESLRTHVTTVAQTDVPQLNAELAGLGNLSAGERHAR